MDGRKTDGRIGRWVGEVGAPCAPVLYSSGTTFLPRQSRSSIWAHLFHLVALSRYTQTDPDVRFGAQVSGTLPKWGKGYVGGRNTHGGSALQKVPCVFGTCGAFSEAPERRGKGERRALYLHGKCTPCRLSLCACSSLKRLTHAAKKQQVRHRPFWLPSRHIPQQLPASHLHTGTAGCKKGPLEIPPGNDKFLFFAKNRGYMLALNNKPNNI